MEYYRVEKSDGKWSLYDNNGRDFFSLGVDCVTVVDVDLELNNEVYTLDSQWFPRWMDVKLSEMGKMGFNTLGAWHHRHFWGNGYPKAVELRLSQHAKKVNTVWGMGFPDVFDESFDVSIHKSLIDIFHGGGASLLQDEGVIGYYTDNEIHWWGSGGYWGDNEQAERGWSNTALVDDFIGLGPEASGKKRWVRFLSEKHGSIEALNERWDSEYSSFKDLLYANRYRARPEILQMDKLEFLRLVAKTYFEKTDSILKAYDPKRLNLGCRYVGNSTPDVVLKEGSRYVDIDSFNFYSMSLPEEYLEYAYEITKKPMMITEFSYCAGREAGFLESNNGSRNVIVKSQERRAECYGAFVKSARKLPFMLGTHWFAMFDYGRNVHGLIGNYGLYDLNAKPYANFIKGVAHANQEIKGNSSSARGAGLSSKL
ncbi:MAG: hypothetical protein LBU32_29135 [Clostridiales bacterium]|jgi:hypothetical protein|nr:hypothetical protein [Clostridiales bacterium]